MRVSIRKLLIPNANQIIDMGNVTRPIGYISQDIYETCRDLGLDYEDAEYVVGLYNENLLFWHTGYYAEMRGIPWEIWKELRVRFEVIS